MKKILAIMLIIALMFSFVACSKDDAAADKVATSEELLEKVMESGEDATNAEFSAKFDLELSGMDEFAMMGPMSLEMTGKMTDEKNMEISLKVDAGIGMTIEADLYLSEDKMLIHAPILSALGGGPEYMSLDMATLTEEANVSMDQNSEEVMAVLERFEDETEYSIYDILILDEKMEEVEVTINDESVDTTKLNMTVSLDKAIDMVYALMEFVFEDEEARALLLTEMTEEDIVIAQEEMQDPETRVELESMIEMVAINTFEMNGYINSDFIPVKFDINADVSVDVEGQMMNAKLTGEFEMFNIGGVKSVEMPEVDPAEVMDLTEMNDIF